MGPDSVPEAMSSLGGNMGSDSVLLRGIFFIKVDMGSGSIPYKPRYSLCRHSFHRTDSKDPDIHFPRRVDVDNKITPSKDGMTLLVVFK